jgi:hypothetical protein
MGLVNKPTNPKTSASIGQGLALVFGFVGLFTNPILVFIALFVWMGASSEAAAVGMRGALAGVPVSRAMVIDYRTVPVWKSSPAGGRTRPDGRPVGSFGRR